MRDVVLRAFVCLGVLLGLSATVWAGGALKTNINGLSFNWERVVNFSPESGSLKKGVFDHEESVRLIEDALNTWASVPGVNLSVERGSTLPDGGDTHIGNYSDFYKANPWDCYDGDPNSPCYNPIIFDQDGSIIEDLFGECSQFRILGFSGFTDVAGDSGDPSWTELKRGQAIFNGACIAPAISKPGCPPCTVVLEPEDVRTLVLHEMGHYLGLGHAQVNPDSYNACREGFGCSNSLSEHIPTMFPFLLSGANMLTLHRDDEVSMQRLYGDPARGSCTISGRVTAKDGATELRGVEVVARNVNEEDHFTDAIAYVSGEEAPRFTVKDKVQENCVENCGAFEITGLKAGETYQLCHQRILAKFTETRSIPPLDPPFQGVDNNCPEGQTYTCQCNGDDCTQWNDVVLVTSNDGLDLQSSFLNEGVARAGGCNLLPPPPTYTWKKISLTFSGFTTR
ncbi:MAG: hypothetical protein R3351_02905 [Nitrospirales bacterium]|nr:hypothetical protein [Nitrospirales bacterium]